MLILMLEDHLEAQQWLSESATIAFGTSININIVDTIKGARSALEKQQFDLFLIDLHLPDGSGQDALLYARHLYPEMFCIIATIYSDDLHLFPALRAGASGYLLKDETKEDIAAMLSNINDGIPPLSSAIAQRMMSHFHEPDIIEEANKLTKREQETLSFLVKGLSVKECAKLMEISPHTVSSYLKEIYQKLHVSSRAEMTHEALRLGIIST